MADRYEDFKNRLPKSYVDFVENNHAWVGELSERLGYAVVWSPAEVQENWDGYQMAEFLTNSDRWFPFGSNGGGEMLTFDLTAEDDTVFFIPFIGMSEKEALAQDYRFEDMVTKIRAHR